MKFTKVSLGDCAPQLGPMVVDHDKENVPRFREWEFLFEGLALTAVVRFGSSHVSPGSNATGSGQAMAWPGFGQPCHGHDP